MPPVLEPATGLDELLPCLLARLGISAWDVLVVGDGSGCGWQSPAGWGAVLLDRTYRGRQVFSGAVNKASINFAEAFPYLHALTWYDSCIGRKLLENSGTLSVHIVTDSAITARWGTQAAQLGEPLPRKHLPVWASFREWSRLGYRFTWHWHARMTTGLNYAADLIAGLANRNFAGAASTLAPAARAIAALANIQLTTVNGQHISIYDINPDSDVANEA